MKITPLNNVEVVKDCVVQDDVKVISIKEQYVCVIGNLATELASKALAK